MIKAADSIGANIAEGYGRYAYKENIHFCYYIQLLAPKLNAYINSIKNKIEEK